MDIKSPAQSVPKKSASLGGAVHGDLSSGRGGRERKSLAIALVVAATFLLAAVAIAVVLFMTKQSGEAPAASTPTNNVGNPKKATSVAWVAPTTLPASYEWSSQNTDALHEATFYTDTSAGCAIVTRVMPANSDNETMVAKAGDSEGIATAAIAEGSPLTVADADAEHQYDFDGIETDQTVAVPSVNFDKQSSALFYKQFGEQVAAIGFTCKLATFVSKTAEIMALIKQFTVKTEY